MATVDRHQLLYSANLNDFKAKQLIKGKSIFDRYKIARSTIDKYIDEKYLNFLAYPVKEGDIIEFHGIKVRNDFPLMFADLQGDDVTKYQKIKKETLQHYKRKIIELRNAGKTSEATFLEKTIKFADERFIFCYDEKVVIVAWGMQIREDRWKPIIIPTVNIPVTIANDEDITIDEEPPILIMPEVEDSFTVRFNAGESGNIEGQNEFQIINGDFVRENDIPKVSPNDGCEFAGWDENPLSYHITSDKIFTAKYNKNTIAPIIKTPWWKRFWFWISSGRLKWLLRALLFLLLFFLLMFLLKNCEGCNRNTGGNYAIPTDNDSTAISGPNVGSGGGIYDPNNPYTPIPTPPGYEDVLPPQQGIIPPIDDDDEIIPGNPTIIANRLNILMDNEDKSVMDFAKAFKAKYPDDKYKVIYYDDFVKRIQIEIPKEEREKLKQEIPNIFAQDYELFIFDEALFEGAYNPNDPAFSDSDKSWYLQAINAPEAWNITRGSEKIIVAIVDNGFSLNHPELSSKVVQPYNVWLHSKKIFAQKVDHGTHVAGTAIAIADNNKGICGIAPNCKFMPVQVANDKGKMTTTSVLDGILYAIYQGADVINVSLGGMFAGLDEYGKEVQLDLINNHFKEEERLWRQVMKIAASHNSTIVLAAGNDNVLAGIDAMQRPELFITVSAVDKNNRAYSKADFSNYGSFSDISAPGVGIYSSVGEGGYKKMNGTSMAAPIITGAVALMKSLNDSITNKQIICILQNTGLETQGNIGKLLQLDKALLKVKHNEVVDCKPTPSTGDVQVLLRWNNYNDLDLIVIDPHNDTIWHKKREVASGGKLEIDMNVKYPDSKTPIENIYWQDGGAPEGTYNVFLVYFKQHENFTDNPYEITVKHGDKTDEFTGTINKEKKTIHICTFTLGNASSIMIPPNANNPNMPPANNKRKKLEKERDKLQQNLDRINNELRKIKK